MEAAADRVVKLSEDGVKEETRELLERKVTAAPKEL